MIPPLAALFAWPVIGIAVMRAYSAQLGFVIVIIAGYLLLPERIEIDLPMLPPFDKHTIPILTVMMFAMLAASKMQTTPKLPGLLPKSWLARLFILMIVGGAFGTVLTNPDRIVIGDTVLPGMKPYDGFSTTLTAIMMLLPMLVGRKYLFGQQAQRLLLYVICVAACLYSVLALYEVRMSPQLNRSIYGFFPHSWLQHIRGDGFRPLVFLQHGLHLSLFLCLSILAAAGLYRTDPKYRWTLAAIGWLGITLVLSKSLGALVIVILLLPLVLFLTVRLQLLAAAVIGMMVMTYPILRGADVIPVDRILSFASNISEERAASFSVRVENEDRLLERARERPLFGWGGFARNRVRNEKGVDITIADGFWTIILGQGGWTRYLGEFGLLTLPGLFLFLQRKRYGIEREAAALALILSATLIDAMPNNGISPITWLTVGALWGRLESGLPKTGETDPDQDNQNPQDRITPRYARDFGSPPRRAAAPPDRRAPVQPRPSQYSSDPKRT